MMDMKPLTPTAKLALTLSHLFLEGTLEEKQYSELMTYLREIQEEFLENSKKG